MADWGNYIEKPTDKFEERQYGKPLNLLCCKHCGNDRLFVGMGSYLIYVKCPKCGKEICIADG